MIETKVFSDHPAIKKAKAAAVDRAARYGIPAFKMNDKMGVLWLVAGGPRNQTYWTPERIVREFDKHDPSCSPAYLCDDCIDEIIAAVDEPNKDDIIHEIHARAEERANRNA